MGVAGKRKEGEAADVVLQFPAAAASGVARNVSYNLNGQKLGRKGRVTRERILAATVELLESAGDEPISLSAVARKASLGMTSLYNYFTDLTELLLAVLEPVMATAEDAYMAMLREPWHDEELGARCYRFLCAYYDFWLHHSRLLHLRNSMADNRDARMMMHRVNATQPVIGLFSVQMGGPAEHSLSPAYAMATVLMTGIERTVTVATDRHFADLFGSSFRHEPDHYLRPEARLMELAIRDTREKMTGARDAG